MSALGIGLLLSFGSALGWSGLDATRKVLVRSMSSSGLVVALTLGQAPLFAAWAVMHGAWIAGPGYLVPGSVCLALNVLANLGFVQAIRISPLSLTVPFLSFTPVFTALLALPVLGERPGPWQVAGVVAVVIGAVFLHSGAEEGASDRGLLASLTAAWRSYLREPGSVLMTGVASMWSLTSVVDKVALDHASTPGHALVQTGGVGLLLVGWLALQGRTADLQGLRHNGPVYGGALLFATAAIGLQLSAIQWTLVAVVETVKRAVGNVVSVAAGRTLFGEPVTTNKLVAVACMAAGTGMLALG